MFVAFDFLSRSCTTSRHADCAALARVRQLLPVLAQESDDHWRLRVEALRGQPDDIEAIAIAAECIRRTHGLAASDVQLLAGLALARGPLVEMATGEGKTLTALLPGFCFALRGRGAHIATVNPYLAARDAEFATPVFERL